MSIERFYIDERGGCIAVRDSYKDNPDDIGLHEHTEGVIAYWVGTRVCDGEKFVKWTVPSILIHKANSVMDVLNECCNQD